MNRRQLIELTEAERRAFLEASRTITLSTIDPRGFPHSIAMWFVMDGDSVLMTTYGKSQKVRNIERNPKVALLAETGQTYDTLKGVLIRGYAQILRDDELCLQTLKRVHAKMMGAFPEGIDAALRAQASKRIVMRVTPDRISSWDHSKLGGTY